MVENMDTTNHWSVFSAQSPTGATRASGHGWGVNGVNGKVQGVGSRPSAKFSNKEHLQNPSPSFSQKTSSRMFQWCLMIFLG